MVKYLDNNSGFNSWVAARDANSKKSKFSGFLTWTIVFLLAWWAFSVWFTPKQQPVVENKELDVAIENIANIPVKSIESEKIQASVQGIRVFNISLKDFPEKIHEKDSVKLLADDKEFIEVGLLANGTAAPKMDTNWTLGSVMKWKNSDGVNFSRTIEIKDYVITVKDEIQNNTKRDFFISPYARVVRNAEKDTAGVATGSIVFANEDIKRESWNSISKKSYAWATQAGFIGFEEQYWQTIISMNSVDQTLKVHPLSDGRIQAETLSAPISVPAGKTITITTNLFPGPKTPDVLKVAAAQISGIDQTIDYGWFWFLARPFLWALDALYSLVLNYGLAIILLTICIRILMWPLTRKSFSGMAAMQKMQPEMQRIQKLYANDKMRMQTELMNLYKTSKTSPMSGCLPMLLQIPIFFALYKALLIAVPLRHAGFLWLQDLAVMDPYFILPVLMGLTMWLQQQLQTTATKIDSDNPAAQTQKMMKWMPLLFTVLFAWMPSGLVLYWTVSNLFGIGQMWWIKRTTK